MTEESLNFVSGGNLLATLKIVFLLSFLVIIHEFGHFIVAKKCKIRVNEFALGFGPIFFHKKYGETDYELRLIPLGGFVNLEGEEEHSETEGSFSRATIKKKIAVMAAGSAVNIIFGILTFFIIISIRYQMVKSSGFIPAISYGFNATIELVKSTAEGILNLFTLRLNIDDMTGPVGISNMVSKSNGIVEFIYLLSVISLSLGVTNLLPFVPLDGGKIILLLFETMRKKPLKQETELKIQSIGFFILIMLSFIVTYNDILKIIN